jgi:enoyl-CoA hydratase
MMDRVAAPIETADGATVTIEKRGTAGIVTLARPEKRNALNSSMCRALASAYPQFAGDPTIYAVIVRSAVAGVFSSGADLAEVATLCDGDREVARAAVGEAMQLCWRQESFTKPTVSLMDGVVVGSGFGIGLHGTHRVAGDGYAFACPETGIGLISAGGVCHVLARLPGSIGSYLALTGNPIRRADAFRLGLITHCLPADRFEAVVTRLADADPVDSILDPLHHDPGPGELVELEPAIARCFAATSVEEILGRLDGEIGVHATWAQETAARLRRKSPLALKVTYRLLSEAEVLDLRELLMLEHRVLCGLMAAPGAGGHIRAALVDRCGDWGWLPARLEEVTAAMVTQLFSAQTVPALTLPTRAEMQGWTAEPVGTDGRVRR